MQIVEARFQYYCCKTPKRRKLTEYTKGRTREKKYMGKMYIEIIV